jgi:hypothetical protein
MICLLDHNNDYASILYYTIMITHSIILTTCVRLIEWKHELTKATLTLKSNLPKRLSTISLAGQTNTNFQRTGP